MVLLFKMMVSPGFCFIFSKCWFFWVVSGVKGQKMAQNGKKVCHASYLRKHISYDFQLWYNNIPSFFFPFYQNCDFSGCYGNKRAKNGLKWEKIHSVTLHISATIHHVIFIYAFMVQMIISPGIFFSSFYENIDFPGF